MMQSLTVLYPVPFRHWVSRIGMKKAAQEKLGLHSLFEDKTEQLFWQTPDPDAKIRVSKNRPALFNLRANNILINERGRSFQRGIRVFRGDGWNVVASLRLAERGTSSFGCITKPEIIALVLRFRLNWPRYRGERKGGAELGARQKASLSRERPLPSGAKALSLQGLGGGGTVLAKGPFL